MTLLRTQTIVDAIVARPGTPDGLSMLDDDGWVAEAVSWSALHDRARRMATVLSAEGVGPGGRVGLLGDTSMELVAALQAVWLTGAAITMLPPPSRRADSLQAIVADARLDLIVIDGLDRAAMATGVLGCRALALDYLATSADGAVPAQPHRPDPTDLAILQYTSGSTRSPRGVPVTHGHLAANIEAIRVATAHDEFHPSRMLSWLPLYHDLGLVGFLALPMACGCPLLLQSPATFVRRPASWLEAMSRHGATTSGAPNFAYALMTSLIENGINVTLETVRFLLTGGEPINATMMGRFARAAVRHGLDPAALVPAYGLAESTLAVTFNPRGAGLRVDRIDPHTLERDGRARPDTDGRALVRLGPAVPGTALRIVDRRTGDPVGDREVGHIEIQGASVVGHYWGEPRPPDDAWLRTGDLGYLVDDDLVVCGREKDVLFAAGRNIYPQDVEAAAAEVAGVRAGGVAAFGIAGGDADRLVVAVELRGDDAETVRRKVIAAVLGEVGLAPHAVVTVPAGRLPKTSSGKLRRAETRRLYQSGQLTPAGPAEPSGRADVEKGQSR